jgi:hypothetical protein
MSKMPMPQAVAVLHRRAAWLAAAGAVMLLPGFWLSPERAWPALLMGSFALVCLGLGGLVFVAIQYAAGAVWSIVLRRVGEAMAAVLPIGAAGILAVLLLRPSIYPWYPHVEVEPGGWAGFKLLWLSYPFFVARAVTYIAVWLGFAWAIRRNSNRQDRDGGAEFSRRNTRLSVAFLVAFAITFWLASTDWIMSLEPRWTSTIFGIYNFSGLFLSALAAITLLTLLFRQGPLRGSVSDNHLLDLGRLIVAFSTFWGYIWFSQYMLIWYANLPEETSYMVLRTSFGWGRPFVWNVALNWALPFLLLLPRANKKDPRTLAAGAVLVLVGRALDLYLMVIPPFAPASPLPTLWDLAALALVISGFVLVALQTFFEKEALPIGDPQLPESLHSHA